MAPFKQDSILMIYPRSGSTLVQFGLNDETFMPPTFEIPTVIYRKKDNAGNFNYGPKEQFGDLETVEEVRPIQKGAIVDLEAFLHFLKLFYASILADKYSSNTSAFDDDLANIPVLLVTHQTWSQLQLEMITKFVFENLEINNLLLLPLSLASTFAMVSLQNSLVIDIGTTHTDIIPVVDYTPMEHLTSTINLGGDSINTELAKKLPQLTETQIETLKRSTIFEVLSADAREILDTNDGEEMDEGALDVAAIVTSGRDTREVLEERERKKKQRNVKNAELDTNSFYDDDGQEITVGKQRFEGTEKLIESISHRVGNVLAHIHDKAKARHIWENIIVVGGTSSIVGFREALIAQLYKDHIIMEPEEERQDREDAAKASLSSKKKNKFLDNTLPTTEYIQVPTSIKFAKYPDYFPEWKKHGYSEIPFLGAQIVCKQVFTHPKDTFYITRERYDEKGPAAIWDIVF